MEESRQNIKLNRNSDFQTKIEFLQNLYKNAESRILHSDMFRQRNLNFSLVVFAGLIALGLKTNGILTHIIITVILTLLMITFTIWDRKWHKTKHGWQKSRDIFQIKLVDLINKPQDDIILESYYKEGEKNAETGSWQCILFYNLTISSLLSIIIFEYSNFFVNE